MFSDLVQDYEIIRDKKGEFNFSIKPNGLNDGIVLDDEITLLLSKILQDYMLVHPVKLSGELATDNVSESITDLYFDIDSYTDSAAVSNMDAAISLASNWGKLERFWAKNFKEKFSEIETKQKESYRKLNIASVPVHRQKTAETYDAVEKFMNEKYPDGYGHMEPSIVVRSIQIKAEMVAKIIRMQREGTEDLVSHPYSYLQDIVHPMKNKDGDNSRKPFRGEVFKKDYLARVVRELQKQHK